MSTNRGRLDCDLSASWSSESDDAHAQGPVASASSEEETHVVQYRAFMLKQQQTKPAQLLGCHDETADEAREADEEDMLMSCKFCTKTLDCPRCAEAKRRLKERREREANPTKLSATRLPELLPLQQPLTKPAVKPAVKLADMLRADAAPLPALRPLTQPLQLHREPSATTSATKLQLRLAPKSTASPSAAKLPDMRPLSASPSATKLPDMRPLTAEEKKLDKAAAPLKQRALPELIYYETKNNTNSAMSVKTKLPPLVDISQRKAAQDTSTIKYTSKALPELKARATPISLDAQRLDRLGMQFRAASQAQSAPLRSLLLGQSIKPLACDVGAGAGEPLRNVRCHLRSCHERYFALLEENGLLSEVADLHAADSAVCFLFIVPVTSVLDAQISEPHSEQTARVLRYHVLRVPQGLTLDRIRDRTVLPTLMERDVEVEYREGDHYIGGHRVIADEYFPHHIGHIRGLLDPDAAAVPQADAEEEEEGPPEDLPPSLPEQEPEELPPPMDATQQLLYTQSRLAPVARETLFTRAPLKGVVEKLSMSYYKGALDLGDQYQKLKGAEPVTLTLRVYDTTGLFQRCTEKRLADITRLAPMQQVHLTLHQKHHLVLGDGLCMSDYSAPELKQLRLETAAAGLLELSFSSPTRANQTTRLLCQLQAPVKGAGVGTYMTDNENVLLRFANGALENVLINHQSAMPCTEREESPALGHFFELCLDERARRAFEAAPMEKLAFDALLLKEGTLSKYTRKAKRYVTRKTRDVLSKGEAEKKRLLALKLMPVREGGPLQALFAAPKGAGQASGQLSARLYDRKMKVRDAESVSGLPLMRYTDPVVWYQVQGDNQLYDALQRTDNYYVELDVDQWRHLVFNANDVTAGSQLYYARGAGDDAYVLSFEGQALRAVAKVSRHSTYYKQLK